jgi:hypothetical protein
MKGGDMANDDYQNDFYEESEEDIAYFNAIFDYLELHKVRIKDAIEDLFRHDLLEYKYEDLDYCLNFEKGGVAFRYSHDGGFEYHNLKWISCSLNVQEELEEMVFQLAQFELDARSS